MAKKWHPYDPTDERWEFCDEDEIQATLAREAYEKTWRYKVQKAIQKRGQKIAMWFGLMGHTGYPGPPGMMGAKGDSGKSAYELAVDEGFKGSLQEWLDYVRSPQALNDLLKTDPELRATIRQIASESPLS